MLTNRTVLCIAFITSSMIHSIARAADFSLSYLGQQIIPSETIYNGTTIGGLSSIDYVASQNRYVAISDDRGTINPSRYYNLSLSLDQFQRSQTPGNAGVVFNAVTTIQTPSGGSFAANTVDPEGMRFDAARNMLYWSNEGQRSSAGFQNPTVRAMNLDGSYSRDFSVPPRYNPAGSNTGLTAGDKGVYNNLAFESLAISTDGRTLYAATENALAQDSLPSTVSNGSRSRIVAFDIASGASAAEYIYDVAPVVIGPTPSTQFATNGLTDFVAIGDRQFISIERSFAVGAQTPGLSATTNGLPTGNTIRLFYVDARNATDVSLLDSIANQNVNSVSKTLLLDLSTLQNDDGSFLALDNIEGITLGPSFNGRQSLILVSDNNFGANQFTQFTALQINRVPEPQTYALMLLGIAAFGITARRKTRRD
jgi:hypothetical protein